MDVPAGSIKVAIHRYGSSVNWDIEAEIPLNPAVTLQVVKQVELALRELYGPGQPVDPVAGALRRVFLEDAV